MFPASCCVLISKDALPDFLSEFVREVKKNDGSTQDFEVSNFAMTRWIEETKGEVVCKLYFMVSIVFLHSAYFVFFSFRVAGICKHAGALLWYIERGSIEK